MGSGRMHVDNDGKLDLVSCNWKKIGCVPSYDCSVTMGVTSPDKVSLKDSQRLVLDGKGVKVGETLQGCYVEPHKPCVIEGFTSMFRHPSLFSDTKEAVLQLYAKIKGRQDWERLIEVRLPKEVWADYGPKEEPMNPIQTSMDLP